MTASLGGRYDPWPVKRCTDLPIVTSFHGQLQRQSSNALHYYFNFYYQSLSWSALYGPSGSGQPFVVRDLQISLYNGHPSGSGQPFVVRDLQVSLYNERPSGSGQPFVVRDLQVSLYNGRPSGSGQPFVVRDLQISLYNGHVLLTNVQPTALKH